MFSTAQLLIIFTFHFIIYYAKGTEIPSGLHREKRQLLFPNSTLLQFNVGIGTPSPAALINLNWAIQANFQLPWNRTQIPIDILEANSGYTGPSRKKRADEEMHYENDSRLYHLYKYIEGVLNTFSYNGTDCMLRVLCQVGAEPLEVDDEEDLLHELVGYALNPKNDLEHTAYKQEIDPYVEAFVNGEASQDCVALYKSCTLSLVDLFSKRYNMP